MSVDTPILFLVFNRPDTTTRVFETIRQARPERLYLAADGPRDLIDGERKKCEEVRAIVSNVDWRCQVKTLYREQNLGCKVAVSSAINWFFENEEMGIVLEDDCLPSLSFYKYCEELLNEYKDDERVFLVSGYNKQNTWDKGGSDYFFSHLGGIWGWASWSRAWQHFDPEMSDLDDLVAKNHFVDLLGPNLGRLRQKQFYDTLRDKVDTWDYQWGYSRNKHKGLACVPVKSLIQNIGFGENATHTSALYDDGVTRHECGFPLRGPVAVEVDSCYDKAFYKESGVLSHCVSVIRKIFNAGL